MKSTFIFLFGLLLLCLSCKDIEQEKLLLETQKAYLEELKWKEQMMWQAVKSESFGSIYLEKYFDTINDYRNQFILANKSPSKLNIELLNQLLIPIQEVLIDFNYANFDTIHFSENSFIDMDSCEIMDVRLANFRTHNQLLHYLLNTYSTYSDFYTFPVVLANSNSSFVQEGDVFKTQLSFYSPLSLYSDSIYFGEFDFSKIDPSKTIPYHTEISSDIPLLDYKSDEYRETYTYETIANQAGIYIKSGVVSLASPKGGYEFYPFEFSYEVVDCSK
ncbi:MAG: hypothetical protein ACPG4Z_01780 [Chitinophagales bacterium]